MKPVTLRLILGDQLSRSLSSLEDADKKTDILLLVEVMEEATYVRHHPKKIAFLFAAMRHFAAELEAEGFTVRYVKLTDPENTGSFDGEVKRALRETGADRFVVTEPGEWRVLEKMKAWQDGFDLPFDIRPDTRFLCPIDAFRKWAGNKQQLRMEFFYRQMRKKYGLLLDEKGGPEGGQWNYDKENRKPPKRGLHSPKRISHPKDGVTKEVLALVAERFGDHFGDLEPFHFALTREQALEEMRHFMTKLLPTFGDWQDAMVDDDAYVHHSLLSAYLNAGLLLPLEICQAAEAEYRKGKVPLHSAEGFIRQILGWREYMRGVYWWKMPRFAELNHLDATRPLPAFYWDGKTDMHCLSQAVAHTRVHAYSHHIQRLMVTGNFALLAGLSVPEVCEWYLIVYADAYEWVELPNTLGMALFADGGLLGSKPYAASGKYIHKMSNFCEHCRYDPNEMLGESACPFNALYWDFLARNEKKLRGNQRLRFTYTTWDRMNPERQKAIRAQAKATLEALPVYKE